jgi:DNA polymerase I-like protein with 3'-5' exonuclease and polymerase domains
VPVVLVAAEVTTGEEVVFWGRDRRLAGWVEAHRNDRFVAHNLVAEARYLQALGIRPPAAWWDTMYGYRYVSNTAGWVPFDLHEALEACGIVHWFGAEKRELQNWIGELRFDAGSPEDRKRILAYCQEDVRTTARLYQVLRGRVPAGWMAHLVRYALAVARMETRGIKVRARDFARVNDNRQLVASELADEINRVAPILNGSQIRKDELLRWCLREGIGWPFRTPTGKVCTNDDAWEEAVHWHPFLADVRRVHQTVGQLLDRDVPVDPIDGRHYFGFIPLAQKTGRTSPKRCILGGPKWLRWLLVPTNHERVLVNIDYKSQEIALAAYFAGDDGMLADYLAADFYLAFAIRAGAAPAGATKDSHRDVRARYKSAALGIGYGQSAFGLSRRLRTDQVTAQRLIDQHRRAYPNYWSWRERHLLNAYRKGVCYTRQGWLMRVNQRASRNTVGNAPIQGSGGDLLRETVLRLEEHGLTLLATNHDSFLLEVPRKDLDDARVELDAALHESVEAVFPGCPLGWEVAVYKTRYKDPDGEKMWQKVEGILAEVKAGAGRGVSGIEQVPV